MPSEVHVDGGARVRVGAIAAVLAVVAACSVDAPLTQPPDAQVQRSGQVFEVRLREGLEMVRAGEYEVRGEAPTSPSANWRPDVVEARPRSHAQEGKRYRFPFSAAMDSMSRRYGPRVNVQPRIQGDRYEFAMADGTPASAVVARRMRGRSRVGDYTLAIYVRDRLHTVQEVAFRQRDGGMQILASRMTKYDSSGAMIASVDGSGEPAPTEMASALSAPRDALDRVASLFVPRDAYASLSDEPPCTNEFLATLALVIANGVLFSDFGAKFVACMSGNALMCPLVGPASLMLTSESIGLIIALRILSKCLKDNYWSEGLGDTLPPIPPDTGCTDDGGDGSGSNPYLRESMSSCEGGSTTGGGGGGGITCITIDWYIVYPDGNGGYTMEWIDQFTTCYNPNEA